MRLSQRKEEVAFEELSFVVPTLVNLDRWRVTALMWQQGRNPYSVEGKGVLFVQSSHFHH